MALASFAIPITWTELVKRTVREASADNCLGLAAQLAYYLLLALVPAIVFLVALLSFVPADVIQQMLGSLHAFAPPDVFQIVRDQVTTIQGGSHGGLLTFGVAAALWSSSSAIAAVTDALNSAYDIEEGRPWWKVRLVALGLTAGLAAFVIAAFVLIMSGSTVGGWAASHLGLGHAFAAVWDIARWPVAFALVIVALAILNYYGPDAEQDWTWVTPGAVLAAVLWLVTSLAFKFYLAHFADYNKTYGSLGGVIVLMLWFYLTGLAVLVGAEMNAEIEHASPWGKNPGEKVPGERRKLGAAAARAWRSGTHRGEQRPTRTVQPPRPQPAGIGSKVAGGVIAAVIATVRRRRARQ